MNFHDKIYISGHNGMVGSAILRNLRNRGFTNILTKRRSELDLTKQKEVQEFFLKEKPKYVILAAAKVGGIYANNKYPADFIYENLMIETNVIHSAYLSNVTKLLFLGSTCIYPREVKQPMKEEALLSAPLEPTNEPYAIAKIAGIKLCESYNRQYGTDFRSLMPTNLYGINDNFHPNNSHVIPALISRFHEAKISKNNEVVVWGSGNVKREFLFVDDLANAAMFVLELKKHSYNKSTMPNLSHINVGTGVDHTIQEVVEMIQKTVGFKGNIIFDTSKPDGTPRKLIDVEKLSNLGWDSSTTLKDGLKKTYKWYSEIKI
jgi:GDP-L-fucose synthase